MNEIVRAGAGAGKTYTLTHKVMDIAADHLKREGRFPRLVVTTFTRKATQELRERLMLLALEERPELVDFVNSRSHLVVSTIHGVMDLFLKRYGANICIDPGYRIVEANEAAKIARQTLRRILLSGADEGVAGAGELLESFPFNQLATIVRRIDAVLAENPDAKPFLSDDFARAFQGEARHAAALLKASSATIRAETDQESWHQLAEDQLKLAKLLENGDWRAQRETFLALKATLKAPRRNQKKPVSEEMIEESKAARDQLKRFAEPVFDPEVWAAFAGRYELIDRIARRFSADYRQAKIAHGWLEISDLEHLAMDCARKHPATAEAFRREWDHWLIDEYQDTSPFQVELLRLFSSGSPSFLVGDPQQSIYLFRGARSDVFAAREREIVDGGGARRLLSVNRRSRPELLLFLNDFFSRLDPPFQEMEPFLKDGEKADPKRVVATFFIAEAGLAAAAAGDSAESDGEDGGADGESAGDDETAGGDDREMRAVVRRVQELLANGAKPEDICVLARTNGTLAEVAGMLGRYRLPTHVHAAAGFFDRREIRDALALLKFLVNPHDGFNTIELLRSPWFRVPDDALADVASRKRATPGESLWDRLLAERSMSDELAAVRRLQDLLQRSMRDGLSETFKQALIEAGLIDLAHRHDVSGRRESNVWKLLSRLQQEESRAGFNPLAFVTGSVADLSLGDGNAEGDAVAAVEPDRINLMTVHASKGLEFKHVILPRMAQKPRLTTNESFTYDERVGRWALRLPFGEDAKMTGSLPEVAWLRSFQAHERDEHARVLYVALTRASETVFASWTLPEKPLSWASMVRFDLADGAHETASYTYVVDRSDPRPLEIGESEVATLEPRIAWRETHAADETIEKAVSVTDVMDRKPGADVKTETKREIPRLLQLASRGTAVHRLMELLKYPSRDRLARLIGQWFPGQEDSVLAAVEFVRESTVPPLLEVIHNGEVEWGFGFLEDGFLIEGQIDLWGRSNDGDVWLVDYKTGNPEFREKAFAQMGLYSLALRRSGLLKPEEKLQLAAVFPFARKVYVAPEPPLESIKHMLR